MHKNILIVVGITILFLGIAVAPLTQGIVNEVSDPFGITFKKNSPTVLLDENFSGTFPPEGWETDWWTQCNSSYCSPEPPCAYWYKYNQGPVNDSYITSKAVDASEYKTCKLRFYFGADLYYPQYCSFYVRFRRNETAPWKDITPWDNPLGEDMEGQYYEVLIINSSEGCGDALQINWSYMGYYYYANYFWLDDVKILCGDDSNTLYVGGSGPGNYTKIQDAIDNASDGDTVFVYDDSSPYYENVFLNKTINLIGEDRHTTIIDVSYFWGSAIRTNSNYNNIRGFTLTGGGGGTFDTGIAIRSDFNTIQECNLINGMGSGIYLRGNYNKIKDNLIAGNNQYGIYAGLYDGMNNTISNNSIIFNGFEGIAFSKDSVIGNKVYHNDFIDNKRYNARDHGSNFWDDGYFSYPSAGNFWSDYNGTDADGDGIGDTPYYIYGGDNKDRYPLMEQLCVNLPPHVSFTWDPYLPYTGDTVIFNASESYDYDGYITLYEWDWDDDGVFDENHTSPITTHSWTKEGRYNITLRVTDNASLTFQKMKRLYVWHVNQPPEAPIIDGPTRGKAGVEYNYTFIAFDPEGDQVYYAVIFEGGQTAEWIGPYDSGEEITLNYSWDEEGTFIIVAMAMDVYQAVSNISSFQVEIPRTRATFNSMFYWFLERFPLLERLLTFVR